MADFGKRRPFIVAVDGPAGSGKSSICEKVCEKIGWSYVNTGALYRALSLAASDLGIALEESPAFLNLLSDFCSKVNWHHQFAKLYFNNIDMTPRLNSVEAASGASTVAKMSIVRNALLPLQRRLSLEAPVGAIVDGRDIGTVVFPDADLKIFMTASLEERANRRLKQLERSNPNNQMTAEEIMNSIAKRDSQDSERQEAPLKVADDAQMFDTSDMSIAEAIDSLVELLKDKNLLA